MAGDEQTGVSIMRLTAGLDSGPVCLAATEPILPADTYGSLAPRLSELGGELLARALTEAPPFLEQSEDGVTYAEKIEAADRLLDPGRPASELERVVRALHPHIGARLALADGTLLGVHRAVLADDRSAGAGGGADGVDGPGVQARDGRLLLGCTPGTLELLEVQPPGGRAMDASSYLRGHGLPGRR
jgi:methionyl-tRNA formyltransferase